MDMDDVISVVPRWEPHEGHHFTKPYPRKRHTVDRAQASADILSGVSLAGGRRISAKEIRRLSPGAIVILHGKNVYHADTESPCLVKKGLYRNTLYSLEASGEILKRVIMDLPSFRRQNWYYSIPPADVADKVRALFLERGFSW